MTLQCPYGSYQSARFASYGTPTGSCETGYQKSSCDAKASVFAANGRCGRTNYCWAWISSSNLGGDPCPDTPLKWMGIIARCVYSSFSTPWITQGINVTSPLAYVPFNRFVVIVFHSFVCLYCVRILFPLYVVVLGFYLLVSFFDCFCVSYFLVSFVQFSFF